MSLGRVESPSPALEGAPPLPGTVTEAGLEPTPVPVSAAPPISPSDARITLTLNQIPLGEALRYIASQAGLKVKVEPYAISIIPINEQSSDLFTKEYRVPPGFVSSAVNVGANPLDRPATRVGGNAGTGKDTQESTGGQQLVTRADCARFPQGSGRSVSVRGECQFPPAEQPVDCAEHRREPRVGGCAGGTGQRCRTQAGGDRSEIRRDHAK